MGWKYVMVLNKIGDTRFLIPVIFPDKLVHSEVYGATRLIMPGWRHAGVKAISAGSIEHLEIDGLGGRSETLSINSRPEDRGVIENYSYEHGILPAK
jgi:hypothetical protein